MMAILWAGLKLQHYLIYNNDGYIAGGVKTATSINKFTIQYIVLRFRILQISLKFFFV